MTATSDGNKKVAQIVKEKYGEDFYKIIGAKGGRSTSGTGGFGSPLIGADGLTGPERAKLMAAKRWERVRRERENSEVPTE